MTGSQFGITDYSPSDFQSVIDFFWKMFDNLGHEFDLTSKDKDLSDIPNRYQSGGGIFLIATRQLNLVGTIGLRPLKEDVCELKRFYVLPEFQRQGVGTRLLEQLIDHARSRLWSAIRLDTTRKSAGAISLFRKYGFVEIERYNDDEFAENFFELKLR
jgi:ribosomal protein S18 acetylase RimI-like enzyme